MNSCNVVKKRSLLLLLYVVPLWAGSLESITISSTLAQNLNTQGHSFVYDPNHKQVEIGAEIIKKIFNISDKPQKTEPAFKSLDLLNKIENVLTPLDNPTAFGEDYMPSASVMYATQENAVTPLLHHISSLDLVKFSKKWDALGWSQAEFLINYVFDREKLGSWFECSNNVCDNSSTLNFPSTTTYVPLEDDRNDTVIELDDRKPRIYGSWVEKNKDLFKKYVISIATLYKKNEQAIQIEELGKGLGTEDKKISITKACLRSLYGLDKLVKKVGDSTVFTSIDLKNNKLQVASPSHILSYFPHIITFDYDGNPINEVSFKELKIGSTLRLNVSENIPCLHFDHLNTIAPVNIRFSDNALTQLQKTNIKNINGAIAQKNKRMRMLMHIRDLMALNAGGLLIVSPAVALWLGVFTNMLGAPTFPIALFPCVSIAIYTWVGAESIKDPIIKPNTNKCDSVWNGSQWYKPHNITYN